MKKILFFIICVFIIGCKKPLLKHKNMTLKKRDYYGSELKINGYYFTIDEFENNKSYKIFFLYSNGVILDGLRVEDNELLERENEFKNGFYYEFAKDKMAEWGVFNIDGNNIKYEFWPSGESRWPYTCAGKILNDTTFQITESYTIKRGKKKEFSEENKIYHFKAFSPKPDSTNEYIK